MTPWLIVAGDFTRLGGMDRANYALAQHLAARGDVHLVTHRAAADLASLPTVTVHRAWRPWGRHLLGSPWLDRVGRRTVRRLGRGARVVVNGGNCDVRGANWVHYLHAAYAAQARGSTARQAKMAVTHRRDLAAERRALQQASVVICNSERTRTDVIERVGVDPARVHVVYYGADAGPFGPATAAERRDAKRALGCDADRPLVGFVGALGDRRKGFDTLFAAFRDLCRDARWDADLLAVGAGAELEAWRRRAAGEGLASRIRFAGFRADVPQVLAAFDALVHPARYEAYGLSVQEALCRGVPALVSARAGVAERYTGAIADLLIPDPESAPELGARLAAWRGRLEWWRDAVAGVSQSLRARSWDTMSTEIAALVEAA